MKKVSVNRFEVGHVLSNHKILFNTNNHGSETPEDYAESLIQTHTRHWIDAFHAHPKNGIFRHSNQYVDVFGTFTNDVTYHTDAGIGYGSMEIRDESHLNWLKRAAKIGMISSHFPRQFADELDDICAQYGAEFMSLLEKVEIGSNSVGQGVFIRTEAVSLKCGQHGAGPYHSFREVTDNHQTLTMRLCSSNILRSSLNVSGGGVFGKQPIGP